MYVLLDAHRKARAGKGRLKPKDIDADVRAAIAELQEAVKRVDQSFEPRHKPDRAK